MHHGFVYMLKNEAMPGVVKIGSTERSPHLRCRELSRSTGVPMGFRPVCYVEVADCQAVERRLHRWLADRRVNDAREFFAVGERGPWLVGLFKWMPEKLAFTDVCVAEFVSDWCAPWDIESPYEAPYDDAAAAVQRRETMAIREAADA